VKEKKKPLRGILLPKQQRY